MTDGSIPPPRIPGKDHPGRRPITSLVGTLLTGLGSVDVVGWLAISALQLGGLGPPPAGTAGLAAMFASFLGLLTSCGLIATGLLVLQRNAKAVGMTFATIGASVLGALTDALFSAALGNGVVLIVGGELAALLLYGGILAFLHRPATRAEFASTGPGEPGH